MTSLHCGGVWSPQTAPVGLRRCGFQSSRLIGEPLRMECFPQGTNNSIKSHSFSISSWNSMKNKVKTHKSQNSLVSIFMKCDFCCYRLESGVCSSVYFHISHTTKILSLFFPWILSAHISFGLFTQGQGRLTWSADKDRHSWQSSYFLGSFHWNIFLVFSLQL